MDKALTQSWRRTEQHLRRARDMLGDERDLPWFDEWLTHNELGLAFEVLVDAGDSTTASRSFWKAMKAAAEEMGLTPDGDVHGKAARIVEDWLSHDETGP